MMKMNRREFSALTLAAAAALRASETKPDFAFPTSARERVGIATYPFRDAIGPGKKTLVEFAATIPGTFGVHGIEPWSKHFDSTDAEYVKTLGAAFQKSGLRVVNIPVDIDAKLCGTDAEQAKTLDDYHRWVDAAVILGAPGIRVHLPEGTKGNDIGCAVKGLGALAQYGASKKIVINVENDDPGSERPERIVRVLKAVHSPYLRSLPDFGNSMAIHNDQAYNRQALSMLFPLAYSISHVKNMLQDGKTVYRIDMDPLFAIAQDAHYKGFFSMEWDAEGDPYEGTKRLVAASLRALG